MVKYSFVVPAYNEEAVLELFYQEAIKTFSELDGEFEILLINDGSKDKTLDIISRLAAEDKRVKGISFSRNFGQEKAMLAGLTYAKGEAVITMDADLQDPPSVAMELIEKWKQGAQVVHARYNHREGENSFKKLTSSLFYSTLDHFIDDPVPGGCSTLRLFDRKAVNAIVSLGEESRFLRAEAMKVGFKQEIITFDRPARAAGVTKYSLKKMIALARSSVLPNTNRLHELSLKSGLLTIGASIICYIVFIVLTACGVSFGGLTAWLFPTIFLAVGILLLNSGLQNEYLNEIYKQSKHNPKFIVDKTFNIEE